MSLPPFYTLFCLAVIGCFAYTKYQGMALFSTGMPNRTGTSSSSGSSGSSFHYVGTSGGFHK